MPEPSIPEPSEAPTQATRDVAALRVPPARPEPREVPVGELLADRYRLERLAGQGGIGRVYEATDTRLNRRVAVKFIGAAGDEAARESVVTEARAMAGLSHPNLCRVLEAVLEADQPFIVMEWVEGVDLRGAVRTLGLSQRVSLFLQIVDAVAAMHAAGLTHRDLKPGNILLNRRGEPVIVDFGLASGGTRPETPAGGTPGYAAPEQFDEPPAASPRSDVYALGVVLFELLTNRAPFTAASHQELLRLQRSADPPAPESLVADLPAGLQRISLAALERDPALRYADAEEMALDLRRHLRGETVLARPTVLAARFEAQLEEQLERARHWEKQGLITREESRSLYRQLSALMRPDSPWIIDSRKLTTSQVGLYLGGWMTLLAITVGLWRAWEELAPFTRVAAPAAVTAALYALGAWLHSRQTRRFALGYLITASLATPALIWVFFRETGWLSAGGKGMGAMELFASAGLFNDQMLAISGGWLVTACVLRIATGSGAFTFTGAVAAILAWASLFLSSGGLAEPIGESTWAHLGARFALLGVVGVILGTRLSGQEESIARELGRQNLRRHDSWPVLTTGVFSLALGLGAWGYFDPQSYGYPEFLAGADAPTLALRALAFIGNGCVLIVTAALLGRRWSAARDRLASLLRWVIPSHFLGALLAMEHTRLGGAWLAWLLGLSVLSVLLCFVSVLKQWKPFLINGLVYIAVAYARAFDRVDSEFNHSPRLRLALFIGLAAVGLFIMIAAWKLPDWLAGTTTWLWLQSARRKISKRIANDPLFGDSAGPR
ncbi:MAG: serine/threonine-protein kinase [Phycisphaerales bacterium]